LAATDVGAAAGAVVVGGVVALEVALELLLELPHAAANNATAATTKRATGRGLPTFIGCRDTRGVVIGRTLIARY
jgi:hypothetical protein